MYDGTELTAKYCLIEETRYCTCKGIQEEEDAVTRHNFERRCSEEKKL
jgi:hypothetical protein